jgi:hypothetical protein
MSFMEFRKRPARWADETDLLETEGSLICPKQSATRIFCAYAREMAMGAFLIEESADSARDLKPRVE